MRDAATGTAAELYRQATQLRQDANYAEAERCLLRALELEHDCAAAHLELGLTYRDQARMEDAVDYFQLAVHFAPALVAGWLELAGGLARLGRLEAALVAARRATALEPRNFAAWLALGNLLKAGGDWSGAVDCYRMAAASDGQSADAHCRLGYALYMVGRYTESRAAFDAALALDPGMVQAHHNLGLLLHETGQAAQALASFQRALEIDPQILETRACVAHALRDLGRFDEAISRYDEVLAADSRFADAVINRSYALLMRDDYPKGWAAYEQRFTTGGQVGRDFPYRPWQGEALTGKRILVYAEQGLGDEIMFASCIPDLLAQSAQCVVECNNRLAPLFRRSFPHAHVHGGTKQDDIKWLAKLPPVDCQVAIGSLPHYFRQAASDFPARPAYLKADPRRVEYWSGELKAGTSLRVGIAWRGGTLRSRRFVRSIALPLWAPLLRSQGAAFYALQYGDIAAEVEELRTQSGLTLTRLGGAIDDLDELAAIIGSLDLVISIDNTISHLAGSLGKAVWTLLPESPEWRYPRRGARMSWYPSMRLFRRSPAEGWEAVLEQVAAALAQMSGQARNQA